MPMEFHIEMVHLYYLKKKKEKLSIIDERHPGPNCIYV